MKNLQGILNDLFRVSMELEQELMQHEKQINAACSKPLKEMGISEKIKVAKLLISFAEKQ